MINSKPDSFSNFTTGGSSQSFSYSYPSGYDELLFCVRCNSDDAVSNRSFLYSHIPTYVYLICVLNLFIGLIVIALSAGQHRIDVPCCGRCWQRYRIASIVAGLSILLFLASLVGGVAMMLNFDSGYAFFPLPLFAVALMAVLSICKRRCGPRVKRSDKHEVVVDAGRYGLVTFAKTTIAKLSSTA